MTKRIAVSRFVLTLREADDIAEEMRDCGGSDVRITSPSGRLYRVRGFVPEEDAAKFLSREATREQGR